MTNILQRPVFWLAIGLMCCALVAPLAFGSVIAAQETPAQPDGSSPLHPVYPLLDAEGQNVLDSAAPVSTLKTCGTCHDSEFISTHSAHVDVSGSLAGPVARDWQTGIGWYGGWNALAYQPVENLSAEDWVKRYGWRHVGGGPALEAGVEMNCFLCHMNAPNNDARIAALENEQFAWANTATLVGTGIVQAADAGWAYDPAAFDASGDLLQQYVSIGEPRNANCGQCHGVTHDTPQIPLTASDFTPRAWTTLTTGQVFSPQRLSETGLNLSNKDELTRSWDVHAERVVNCVDCHYSLNNPVFAVEPEGSRPDHLVFDPRRLDFGEYLERPLHQFANGGQEYVETFPVFENAERDCATCHDAVSTHDWLPYAARHIQQLTCETCHIPKLFAPAVQVVDWTVVNADGSPRTTYRGVADELVTGYTPLLLPDDKGQIAPYNMVSAWYWVYGSPARPVTREHLQAVYLETGGGYAREVLDVFDADSDGVLTVPELVIDSDAKQKLIAERLVALGLDSPRIAAETEAYAIHHNVTHSQWATGDCRTCHSDDSRLNQPVALAGSTPGGIQPTFISDNLKGTLEVDETGMLFFAPDTSIEPVDLYVLGHNSVAWIDTLGALLFVGVVLGVSVHGGLRYAAARRMPKPDEPELRRVYMYSIYERQWHWLQTVVIFGLIFTGMIIHKPDVFGAFSFNGVVFFHNAFALILVINAALAAFYHLASGEIRQFLPEPHGFFGQMFAQAKYYIVGIFRGDPHPFEKTRDRKMNPIQKLTYFGLLNILLPGQVITGALMWGAQHFPGLTETFGGLPLLAPLHTLISWLLASFIIVHVYMTTTGHTPTASIRAMILGWDEVETHAAETAQEPAAGD